MNALVKKEIRLLLPSFLVGCALTPSILLVPQNPTSVFFFVVPFLFCPAVMVMLALSSFGAEVSSGNFSALLSQPVPRLKIWQTKILALGLSLLIIGILYSAAVVLRVAMHPHAFVYGGWLIHLLTPVILFELVAFSGGLWTVLLLRQVAAAFWFTVLIPGVIVVILAGLFAGADDGLIEGVAVVVFGVYSLIGLFFARWLFMRAQDVAWTGGNITLPEMRGLARFKLGSGNRRLWRPRAALLAKEFQLHQSLFVLAGALALLHLGVLAARKFGNFRRNSDMEFILEIFWGLWLVMPMLAGCAAAAEERKLGTLEGQVCLPVKRRGQFAAKFSVVLFLSILFGVLIPLLLEGTRILPHVHFKFDPSQGFLATGSGRIQMSTAQTFFWNCVELIYVYLPFLTLAGIAAAIGVISFYASTLARNTLQALAPAVLGLLLTWFLLLAAGQPVAFGIHLPWRGWLIYFIGVPVLSATLAALAYGNFKRVFIGWQVWRRNLLVLLVMLGLVTIATTAIYNRAWEKLTPFEPPHGAARFKLSNPPTLVEQWSTFFVRLPDGRIWTDDCAFNTSAAHPLALVLGDIRLTSLGDGHFLDGSNWLNMSRYGRGEMAGIKTDGTLWVSKALPPSNLWKDGRPSSEWEKLSQFGDETNWSSAVPSHLSSLLVKTDGTLWRWGAITFDFNHHRQWPGLWAFTPYRLGAESNWAEAFTSDYQTCLRKTDGSVWATWVDQGSSEQTKELESGFSIQRAPQFEHGKWRSTTTTWSGSEYRLGVRDDGTFRTWADQKINNQSHSLEWAEVDLQFGKDTNWLAVAGRREKIVTLKDDGTLWLWNFYHDSRLGWDTVRDEREMLARKPVRLGTHSDWIAIASADGGIISLAADGSLWYWPLERPRDFEHFYGYGNGDGSHFEPLLDASRKPQLLGNVFGKTD